MRKGNEQYRDVPAPLAGAYVLTALTELYGLPKDRARTLLNAGAVFLNRRRATHTTRVRQGQTLRVDLDFEPPHVADLTPRLLFRDHTLIAIDKPAGMPSVPTRIAAAGTLRHAIAQQQLCRFDPFEVHRLDAPTSGVIVFARRGQAAQHLAQQFARGTVHKTYLARVHGQPPDTCVITVALRRHPKRRHLWQPLPAHVHDPKAKRAETHFRVTARDTTRDIADLTVAPRTGRTHQIRVHLQHLGHPICGDHTYGDPTRDHGIRRLWLHAHRLRLIHPKTKAPLELVAPSPFPTSNAADDDNT